MNPEKVNGIKVWQKDEMKDIEEHLVIACVTQKYLRDLIRKCLDKLMAQLMIKELSVMSIIIRAQSTYFSRYFAYCL